MSRVWSRIECDPNHGILRERTGYVLNETGIRCTHSLIHNAWTRCHLLLGHGELELVRGVVAIRGMASHLDGNVPQRSVVRARERNLCVRNVVLDVISVKPANKLFMRNLVTVNIGIWPHPLLAKLAWIEKWFVDDPLVLARRRRQAQKNRRGQTPGRVSSHVGLLVNEPPDTAGLPFI